MKILQIIDGESYSGIYKLISELCNNIDKIDIDFLIQFSNPELKTNNIYNFNVDRTTLKGKIEYLIKLYRLQKKNRYDIFHINSGTFLYSFQVASIAKICGVKKIISHSHSVPENSRIKKIIITFLRPIYTKMINLEITCSKIASKSLFGNENAILIKNGIDVKKNRYNERTRNEYRKKLRIDNKKVYAHIGAFNKEKKHDFLIELFYELQKDEDSVLLLIGTGKLEENIKEKVRKLKIDNKVFFLGFRNDIDKILNAADIFLFPSLNEGLGMAVIEAQTSGIPVFVSNGIPEEANISKNFHKINSYNINEWKQKIKNVKTYNRENAYKDTIKAGYDINKISKKMQEIYIEINQSINT